MNGHGQGGSVNSDASGLGTGGWTWLLGWTASAKQPYGLALTGALNPFKTRPQRRGGHHRLDPRPKAQVRSPDNRVMDALKRLLIDG